MSARSCDVTIIIRMGLLIGSTQFSIVNRHESQRPVSRNNGGDAGAEDQSAAVGAPVSALPLARQLIDAQAGVRARRAARRHAMIVDLAGSVA